VRATYACHKVAGNLLLFSVPAYWFAGLCLPPFNVHFQLPCCLTIPLRPFSVCKMIIIIIKWVRERRTCVSRCWRCYRTRQHTLETGYFSRRTMWKSKGKGRDRLCTSSPLFFFLNSRHKCSCYLSLCFLFLTEKRKTNGVPFLHRHADFFSRHENECASHPC
jgi:hypothetical protein